MGTFPSRVDSSLRLDCGNHDKHTGVVIPSHFAPDDFLHGPIPSSGEPGAQPARPQTRSSGTSCSQTNPKSSKTNFSHSQCKPMIDPLKSLGIEKGRPFQPDDKIADILESAAQEALARFDVLYGPCMSQGGRIREAHQTLPSFRRIESVRMIRSRLYQRRSARVGTKTTKGSALTSKSP
jgi:hypothetical protein